MLHYCVNTYTRRLVVLGQVLHHKTVILMKSCALCCRFVMVTTFLKTWKRQGILQQSGENWRVCVVWDI